MFRGNPSLRVPLPALFSFFFRTVCTAADMLLLFTDLSVHPAEDRMGCLAGHERGYYVSFFWRFSELLALRYSMERANVRRNTKFEFSIHTQRRVSIPIRVAFETLSRAVRPRVLWHWTRARCGGTGL